MISDDDLVALQQHFATGRTPSQWKARERRAVPEITITLHVIALATTPVDCVDPWIATDGSAAPDLGVGACAAVTSAGHILAGWYDDGLPVANGSAYAELHGIRLGMRLAAALPPGTIIPIVCDSHSVVNQVRRAVDGDRFDPTTFECSDHALFSEVTRLGRDRPVMVVPRAHTTHGGRHRAAAGHLEGVAHRLAWTITRLMRDGLDPAAEQDLLFWSASRATLNSAQICQGYKLRLRT